jgi:hypothetical protein
MQRVFANHGMPKSVVSDRDPRWRGNSWQNVHGAMGVSHLISTAYHPETDGQTDWAIRVLKEMLAIYINANHDDWDHWLPLVQFSMNYSRQESICTTLFLLNNNEHPVLPNAVQMPRNAPASHTFVRHIIGRVRQAWAAMAEAQNRQREQPNRHHRHVSYCQGDLVMPTTESLNFKAPGSRKFMPKWVGPFPVAQLVSPVNVRLLIPTHGGWQHVHPVFHVLRV